MHRRDALRAGSGVLTASLAGCLDALQTESAWRDLIVNRPEAVYVPPTIDGTVRWGVAKTDDYAITLSATRPHRFWTVTGRTTTQISMRQEHSVHAMVSVRERATGHRIPAAVKLSIHRNEDTVAERTLWPMLSQRMGTHHGDNVVLPSDDTYRAEIRVIPEGIDYLGSFASGFELTTVEIKFDYAATRIEGLDHRVLDQERRGEPGALEPMGGGDTRSSVASIESLPGASDEKRLDDLVIGVAAIDDRLPGDELYLAVFPRTPYNRFFLARTALSAVIDRGGHRTTRRLPAAIDPDLGHHYGVPIGSLASDDRVTVSVNSPPQLARHEGYETAFLETGSVTPSVPE